jgi:hypothetical protein
MTYFLKLIVVLAKLFPNGEKRMTPGLLTGVVTKRLE